MTEQAFIRALKQAVDAQDEQEAARLVREHKQALVAFLERMLAQLALNPTAHCTSLPASTNQLKDKRK